MFAYCGLVVEIQNNLTAKQMRIVAPLTQGQPSLSVVGIARLQPLALLTREKPPDLQTTNSRKGRRGCVKRGTPYSDDFPLTFSEF